MIEARTLDALGIDGEWLRPLNDAMGLYSIDESDDRIAMFIAQMAHESGDFKLLEENLNYGPSGLLRRWPNHFTAEESVSFAHDPKRIANRVYADRYENGDEASGDGYLYRGRGPPQLTFRGNYRQCGNGIGVDLVSNPDLLLDPTHGALAAAWYWSVRGLNELADAGAFASITKRIQGSSDPKINGQADRLLRLDLVRAAM